MTTLYALDMHIILPVAFSVRFIEFSRMAIGAQLAGPQRTETRTAFFALFSFLQPSPC
jgi:hypothetical protein